MAEKLGITAPRYRAIENGHYPLPERLIGRFADEAKVGSNTVKEAIISDRRNPLASNVAHPYREGALLIDAAIRKQGWRTRKEAAARLGIRAEELSSIATGRLPVPARMIERLAAALDIPLSTLKEAYGRK
jgi:transcriptional regulator with XRE-family HTH domain